jgi:hypothetical protein
VIATAFEYEGRPQGRPFLLGHDPENGHRFPAFAKPASAAKVGKDMPKQTL